MISATDGLFNAALFKHHILPCSPIRLSQFVVNIRCRQLFHWQQVNTPELSGESSKNKQTSAGVKIPRSALCAVSALLFASPLLSMQHKTLLFVNLVSAFTATTLHSTGVHTPVFFTVLMQNVYFPYS